MKKYITIKTRPNGPDLDSIWFLRYDVESDIYVKEPRAKNMTPRIEVTSSDLQEYFEEVDDRPKSWEDLYRTTGTKGFYMNTSAELYKDQKLRPTKEMAEAQLALSQLMQLRDAWRDGWVFKKGSRHCITIMSPVGGQVIVIQSLSFPEVETRDLFEETFKDLIEKIKPLYFS